MIGHPKRNQNHNDDANARTYECEFTGIALAQPDRIVLPQLKMEKSVLPLI
jgi:hypothetical protein